MMRSSPLGLLWPALAVLPAVASLASPVRAQGRVEIEKTLEVPAQGVTHVIIEHPLGPLTLRGWSRGTVSMKAVKRGPDEDTARRLRVHGEIREGRLYIQTRVLMSGAIPLGRTLAERSQVLREELARMLEKPKPWSASVRAEIQRLNAELVKVHREAFQLSAGTHREYGRAIPIGDAELALTVHVPRGASVEAQTHRGDIDAADLTGGVSLRCHHGRVFARNVAGGVRIRSDQGRQFLSTVQGPVDVDGMDGDVQMREVRGPYVNARLARGTIMARDVHSPLMRFSTTQGGVTITATLEADGHLEVRTLRGDVDVRLTAHKGYRFKGQAVRGRLQVPTTRARQPSPSAEGRGQVGLGRGNVFLRAEYGDVRLW